VTGGGVEKELTVDMLWLLPADVMVGGVVAAAFDGCAGGGGVARAPKKDKMLF
jgi:hypothetical protein